MPRAAYDLLVQAESGLASITGRPEGPGRVGFSACDIAAGLYAYRAILEALLRASAPAKAPRSRSRCSTPWPNG